MSITKELFEQMNKIGYELGMTEQGYYIAAIREDGISTYVRNYFKDEKEFEKRIDIIKNTYDLI